LIQTDEYDQAEIARQYLYATNLVLLKKLKQEIQDWRDLNRLEQKANQFKPKLDAMQEKIVERELAEQEEKKEYASKSKQKHIRKCL
jgi:hypothetical protein